MEPVTLPTQIAGPTAEVAGSESVKLGHGRFLSPRPRESGCVDDQLADRMLTFSQNGMMRGFDGRVSGERNLGPEVHLHEVAEFSGRHETRPTRTYLLDFLGKSPVSI